MEAKYVLRGPDPYNSLTNLSVGQQLYESLISYQHLPLGVIDYIAEVTLSHNEILHTSCCLADTLRKDGHSRHSVIGICSENNRHYITPVLAALYLGSTVTTFNNSCTNSELLHLTNISKPSFIFCSKAALKSLLEIKNQMRYLHKIIIIDTNDDVNGIQSISNYIPKDVWENTDPSKFKTNPVNPSQDVAFILYSSGTTGLPKGVMLTHHNVNASIDMMSDPRLSSSWTPGKDTIIALTPPFHIYGLFIMLFSIIRGQIPIILTKFDPAAYLKIIEKYKVSRLYIVPPLANFLAHSPMANKSNLKSVLYIGCGAAPLSPEVEKLVKEKCVNLAQFRQGYGMTETTLSVVSFYANDNKVGSCGQLLPGMLAKVVDEDGNTLGPNQNGELCFKGPLVMKGYVNDTKSTGMVIDDNGWLATGDVGHYDENEYFYVVDRIKELIKYKGFQVAPAELEALLLTHTKILDVAVVGTADARAGELPTAFVVKKPNQSVTEKEIMDFVADRVSNHKWLRGGVRFVQEIPKGPSGKILRRHLREQLQSHSKL